MVSLNEKRISIGAKSEPIKAFEVWFRTPNGIHSELHAAVKACTDNDWQPDVVISPVSVAVGSTIYEEIGR